MAMNKIERLDREIQKTREKITEYQNKLKELTAQKTEAENLQIVQLVRAMRLIKPLPLQSRKIWTIPEHLMIFLRNIQILMILFM